MLSASTSLFPVRASTMAARVDALYFFLVAIAVFFSVLIAGLIIFFAVRYRRRHDGDVGRSAHGGMLLEVTWTVIPMIIVTVVFLWSASIFFAQADAPADAMKIYVVGKQWMWKFQHLDGQREINELHVPANRDVKLIMTSEDVIHDLFVPAFRMKADVIPGRYTTEWFRATTPGRYHLFCSQYCGTRHYAMGGEVVVMSPQDYEAWLSGGAPQGSLAESGAKLFNDLSCTTCHRPDSQARGPQLDGLYGRTVHLQGGGTVVADESYIRESILNPAAKITEGYQPIMPTFQGLVSEEGMLQLIEYIKSLKGSAPAVPARGEAR